MMTTKRGLRLGACGLIVGIVYLSLGASAMAWNEPLWIRQFGTKGVDIVNFVRGIATDGARSIYVTGSSDFLSWIVKYSGTGRLLWKRQIEQGVTVSGVTTDVAGSVYLTGQHFSILGSVGWLAKYDTSGVLLWEQVIETESNRITNAATDIKSNIYVTGTTEDYFGWIAKYDTSGVLLWKHLIGSSANVYPYAVTTDIKDNVYLAGSTDGAFGGPNRGYTDAWVAKYDTDGHPLWKRQFGTDEGDVAIFAATDAAGRVYVFGLSATVDEQPTPTYWLAKYDRAGHMYCKRQIDLLEQPLGIGMDSTSNLYFAGGNFINDAWITKYDTTGRKQWKRQLGTAADDYSGALALDTKGNVYVTGETAGSLGGSSHGNYDVWVAKYSTQP